MGVCARKETLASASAEVAANSRRARQKTTVDENFIFLPVIWALSRDVSDFMHACVQIAIVSIQIVGQ